MTTDRVNALWATHAVTRPMLERAIQVAVKWVRAVPLFGGTV